MAIPAKPALTPLPPAPQRTDTPTDFGDKADAFVAALDPYRLELAAAINWQDTVFSATEVEANNAANSANAASNSATTSTQARNKAQAWAENAEDNPVEAGQYSALHHAAKAGGFKDSAQTAAAAAQSAAGLPSLVGNAGNSLKVSDSENGVEWGPGIIAEYQEFTASGTWTKDPNASFVKVALIAGGASGSGDDSSAGRTGGGGGGAYAERVFLASELTASVAVTVGAGGAGVTYTGGDPGVTGNHGGSSSFGAYLVARGGQADSFYGGEGGGGEKGGHQDFGLREGRGGYSSGGGGFRSSGGNCVMGGAGGGGTNGSVAMAGGVSQNGGDGGAGGQDANGDDGQFPGGGGGGISAFSGTFTSGSGADGVVRVWQW